MPSIDRIALAAEAQQLEAAGGEWKVQHVMAVLGIARSTVYDTPWLLRASRRVGKNGRRWPPAAVRTGGTGLLKRTGS